MEKMDKLDKKTLKELLYYEKTCEENIIKPMIKYFEIQAEEALIELKEANQNNRKNDLSTIAHSLKSASSQIGLAQVSDTCLNMEKEGRSSPTTDFSSQINELADQIDDSLTELKDFLKEAG